MACEVQRSLEENGRTVVSIASNQGDQLGLRPAGTAQLKGERLAEGTSPRNGAPAALEQAVPGRRVPVLRVQLPWGARWDSPAQLSAHSSGLPSVLTLELRVGKARRHM